MHSSTRGRARVRVLAIHTTEGIMRAAALRDWKSWPGSSHASADETGALLTPADGFVPYDLAAWTLRSGNAWSENIELCGFARWTRAEWLARPKLLEACARWLADRSRARGISLVKLTPAEYRAGGSGVIGHVDHTIGYADGTHTDPGKQFPYDVVLARAQAIAGTAGAAGGFIDTIPEDDVALTPQQAIAIESIPELIRMVGNLNGWPGRAATPHEMTAANAPLDGQESRRMLGVILGWSAPASDNEREALRKIYGNGAIVDVDEQAIVEALAPMLITRLDALSQTDVDRIAEACADVQARRLAA